MKEFDINMSHATIVEFSLSGESGSSASHVRILTSVKVIFYEVNNYPLS